MNSISLILISFQSSFVSSSHDHLQSAGNSPRFSIIILGAAAAACCRSPRSLPIYSLSASKNYFKCKGRCHPRNNQIRINKPLILLSLPLHRVFRDCAPARKLWLSYSFKSDKFIQRDIYPREHPCEPDTYEKQWDDEKGSCECMVDCEEAGHGELEDEEAEYYAVEYHAPSLACGVLVVHC